MESSKPKVASGARSALAGKHRAVAMDDAHKAAMLAAVSALRVRGLVHVHREVRRACRDPARCVHPAVFSTHKLDALHPVKEFPSSEELDGDWTPGLSCNLCMRNNVRDAGNTMLCSCAHKTVLLGESGSGESMSMCLMCANRGRLRHGGAADA